MEPSTSYLWRLFGEGLALCYRGAPGYEVRLTPHTALILSGEPIADLNYAVIDAGRQAESRLREFGQFIQAQQLPIIVLLTAEVANQLASVARELGLQYATQMPLMVYRPPGVHAATGGYQVERVESPLALNEANGLLAQAFGVPQAAVDRAFGPALLDGPGVDVFLARRDGLAISTVQTTCAGASVGIWAMATTPAYQRQGAGHTLLTATLTYHYERGAQLFYLGATAAGKPLYERIGFRTITEGAVWVAGHSTQAPIH